MPACDFMVSKAHDSLPNGICDSQYRSSLTGENLGPAVARPINKSSIPFDANLFPMLQR